MKLNVLGDITHDQWSKLPARFPDIELGEFVVMPNHIHGILIFHDPLVHDPLVPAGFTPAQAGEPQSPPPDPLVHDPLVHDPLVPAGFTPAQAGESQGLPQAGQPQGLPLLGDIVGAYKSLVANACLEIFKSKSLVMGKLWQRNYWEHIIRDDRSLQAITLYIHENPAQWNKDQLFTGDRNGKTSSAG